MAITKIRKIANWILWAVSAVSIVVFALFYFGGETENSPWADKNMSDPKYLEPLIYWIYAMLAFSIIALLGFGIFSFFTALKDKPKAALASLGALVAFGALMLIAYAIGDATPLTNINADSQSYNTTFWLKFTDMWLYSMYIMMALCICGMIGGAILKILNK